MSFFSYLRDGWGTQRVSDPNGDGYLNEYIGTFKRGCKDGEGQMYYANDEVYDGTFKKNKRCGQGIMWFSDGALYLGEWRNDKFNGHGILVQGEIYWIFYFHSHGHILSTANGNRFEGSFSNGKKHGEGIYYHKNSGQVQKGIWIDDLCKCSVMQDDEIREKPKSYSIPEVSCCVKLIKHYM